MKLQNVTDFYEEVVQETKKCTWPTWQELVKQTMLVIFTVILLVLFTFVVDWVVTQIVQFILDIGS